MNSKNLEKLSSALNSKDKEVQITACVAAAMAIVTASSGAPVRAAKMKDSLTNMVLLDVKCLNSQITKYQDYIRACDNPPMRVHSFTDIIPISNYYSVDQLDILRTHGEVFSTVYNIVLEYSKSPAGY